MSSFDERLERINNKYINQINPLLDRINALRAEEEREIKALRETWARENGFPLDAKVEIDWGAYYDWYTGKYAGEPWLLTDHELRVASVSHTGELCHVYAVGVSVTGTHPVPVEFVSLSEDAQ